MTMQSICRKMVVALALGCPAAALADEWSSETPVTEAEMAKYLARPEAAKPDAESDGVFAAGLTLFRCDAWSVLVPGSNYYWISTSLYYARAQALGACQQVNGFSCQYYCQRSW